VHKLSWKNLLLSTSLAVFPACGGSPVDEPQSPEPSDGLLKAGDPANAVILEPAGVLADGTVRAAALTPGDRDSTFAGGGVSTYPVSGVSSVTVNSTLFQTDGKIVVSGMLTGYGCHAYVSRFTSNGMPDPTFGDNGMAKLQISNGPNCHGASAALLPDGKIILATTRENSSVSPATSDYVVVRLNANGSQDYAFNPIIYNVSEVDRAVDVKVTSTGVIVLGGWSRLSNGGNDFIIARFSSTGSMLSIAHFDFQGGNDILNRITLQPDGKILAVGRTSASTGYTDFALARFTSAGAVDTMFGSGGGRRLDAFGHNDVALSVAVQGDGKILVGGSAYHPSSSTTILALFRLNATGTAFDTAFGNSGQAYANPGNTAGRGTTSQALAIQADGKIVSAGNSLYGGSQDVSLVRFTPSGTLDSTFLGGGGYWFEPSPNSADSTSSVLLQTDGKILVGGTSATAIRLSRHVP